MPDLEDASDTFPNDGIFNGAYDEDEDVGDPTSAVQTRGKIQKASSAQQALVTQSLIMCLTHNPTIYDSLVKQFWQTAIVRTLANGTQQLVASIDSKEYTITEASVRSKLQLADATGIHNLFDAEIYVGLATLGYVTEGKYLAPTLTKKLFANMKRGYARDIVPLMPAMLAGAAMDQGEGSAQPAEPHPTPVDPLPSTSLPSNQSPPHLPHQSPPHSPFQSPPYSPPHSSPPRSYEAPLPKGNTSGSVEARIQLKELMVLVPSLVTRVTSLEKELKETKQALGNRFVLNCLLVVRESMKKKSTDFVTPTKASGEAKEDEEISPTIIEAAKTLSKVASQSVSKAKSTDKGKRYRRRARSMAKKINTKCMLDEMKYWQSGDIILTKKTARMEDAIEMQSSMDEEDAKQIHLDKMLAKRVQEEQELSKQQLKRKAKVQKAAQFYTEEDWDIIRAKLEANTEKKFYDEQKAKAKRSKPMTQAQQREYISTFIKNQSLRKLSKLKKLSFEELMIKFEKLMKSIECFVHMETEARVKRHRLRLEQETLKKQKIDIEDASITKGKDEVVKEE
ncbi:hypothetical protein Tco_0922668 [Tanacetum coccineum]|uniref:Uncharacterized protein n=1 Tax=Tanacetum coccineum TaxID=301880 RepID=A0ABQ5D586_9ASTR